MLKLFNLTKQIPYHNISKVSRCISVSKLNNTTIQKDKIQKDKIQKDNYDINRLKLKFKICSLELSELNNNIKATTEKAGEYIFVSVGSLFLLDFASYFAMEINSIDLVTKLLIIGPVNCFIGYPLYIKYQDYKKMYEKLMKDKSKLTKDINKMRKTIS